MAKKGEDFEILAIDFLEKIFTELNYQVVRKRPQTSGSQDGYDNLIEVIDSKYKSYYIYSECKDYTTKLNYTEAVIKIPQLYSTHKEIDLMLFISPKRNFSNIFEETRNKPFLESLSQYHFKNAFLSPETYIKEYFSLYPDIYKKIYLSNASKLSDNDRRELLDKFDKYIFSSRNLKKIIIDENDKESFIGDLEKSDFQIERTIRNSQNRIFFYEDNNSNTLKKSIEKANLGLVLLGNPGYGKSFELSSLAIELWETRDKNNLIPVFYILKNFSSESSVESILPSDYKHINNIILILDGIDEVENIVDFTNKLRNFISQNLDFIRNSKMKFLISCRTNVYKKFIKNISDFEVGFLNEINTPISLQFLREKYNLDLVKHREFDIQKNKQLLENPFYLDLIGENFKNNKGILTNRARLIDKYVHSRLENDKMEKYQNDINFDIDKVISYTQKTAFALESMQKPFLSSSEIKRVITIEAKELSKNPFLEESLDDNWSFVKKNIQEYFVSILLKDLSFDEIINFITIDLNTLKVHPTWYNVLTFLLNLELEKDKYDKLVDWLLSNDYEMLFNADSNRINDDIRSKVLQDFFIKKCVEETLWINDVKAIASFGQSNSNIEYLIDKIKDKKIHRRARVSAVALISDMDVNETYYSKIKKIILNIIKEKNVLEKEDIYLKQDVIKLSETLSLNKDVDFFNKIICILKNNDSKEIVSAIINSVPNKSIETNIDYFLEILDKAIGNKNWRTKSSYNTIYSRKEGLFELFTRIKNPKILLKIYSFLIQRHKNFRLKEDLIKTFSKHIESVFKNNKFHHKSLANILTDAVINDKIRYYEDDLILNIVKTCELENQIFENITNQITGNHYSKHFLARIVNETHFQKIIKLYINKILPEEFIVGFKNILSHENIELARKFEKKIEEDIGYIFKEKIPDERSFAESNKFWREESQRNFDVLFDIEEIINQAKKLYKFYNTEDLTYKDINKVYDEYYDIIEIRKQVTENVKHLLFELLRDYYPNNQKLHIKDVSNSIRKYMKSYIINTIVSNLPKENSSILITENQISFIEKWCFSKTNEANNIFEKHLFKNDSWNYEKYHLCHNIYKIQKYFNLKLDKELLLNMIWFTAQENDIDIAYMNDFVSIEKINQRILKNLEEGVYNVSSFISYIKYCKENNLDYVKININIEAKIYSLLEKNMYYAKQLIEMCFSDNKEKLKEFLNYKGKVNNKSIFIDGISTIFFKNGEEKIIDKFISDNYSSLISEGTYSEIDIIKILITTNNSNVFEKLLSLYRKKVNTSNGELFEFRDREALKYTNLKAVDDLIEIIEFCLTEPKIKNIMGRHFDPLRFSCETLVNICKTNKIDITIDSRKKLETLEQVVIKNKKVDLFYFFKLKNDLQEIYFNHKSKPYVFSKVMKVLNDYKYLFVE